MNETIFIDTNILIYAYSTTELNKRQIARDLLKRDIILSIQIVNEFIWIMTKKYQIDYNKMKKIVNGLFTIYDVALLNQEIVEKSLFLSDKYKYSFWDSLVLSAALESDCVVVYSEDMQHNQIIEERLTIVNPFIKKYK